MKAAAATMPLGKTLEYCEDPIVSTDVIGNPHGCVFDSAMTAVSGNMAKVFGWYDNEWAFSCRMVDMLAMM
jgi:glyceraldehyde 3-phosphate dehydrogenase